MESSSRPPNSIRPQLAIEVGKNVIVGAIWEDAMSKTDILAPAAFTLAEDRW